MGAGAETDVKQPLVSVIIPVYNTERYVREALDNAIGQSYRNLEILVVDDGSTDASGSICDEYQKRDRRVRVIHQGKRGVSEARNTGMRTATGKLIAFLDSDDRFHPEMIEAMVRERSGTTPTFPYVMLPERHGQ